MSYSKNESRKRSHSESSDEEVVEQLSDENSEGEYDEEEEEGAHAEGGNPKSDVPDVHSANKWEEANLGDEQRKAKFLKLMGGAKKEHTGRFVCGEKSTDKPHEDEHADTRKSDNKLEDKLEAQYKESMTNALKQRDKRHRGLGYHGDTEVDLEAREKEAVPDFKPPPPHVHDANIDPDVHFVKSDTLESQTKP
uniref:Small acidic protein n=1 Tax=Plectus sambesii TaxID=2011161 RepID=A0A914V1T1_9BILA